MDQIQKQSEQKLARRRFLVAAARTGALAAMGGLASILMIKRNRLQREGTCLDPQNRLGCRQCREYSACRLPRAMQSKQNAGKPNGQ
jgi:hypothetical protein